MVYVLGPKDNAGEEQVGGGADSSENRSVRLVHYDGALPSGAATEPILSLMSASLALLSPGKVVPLFQWP